MNELPKGWTECEVDQLFNSFSGGTPSKRIDSYWAGTIPWISSGEFSSDIITEGTEFISKDGLENSSAKLCRPGSIIVVVRSGILKHTLPVAIVGKELAINQDIKCFDSGDDEINRWLFLSLKKSAREILSLNREGTTVQSVKYDTLKEHALVLPPPNEQRRIVAKLEKLLSRVNAAQERLATIPRVLKRFRQAVLAAACSGRLTADWRQERLTKKPAREVLTEISNRRTHWLESAAISGDHEAKRLRDKLRQHSFKIPSDEIPETWCWSSLLETCWLVVDCHNKTAPYETEGIALVRTSNIKAGHLLTNELKYVSQQTYEYWSRRCPPQPRDILFTREAPMGESALIPEGFQLCMGQRIMLLRAFEDLTNVRYVAFSLRDPIFLSRVDENAVGSGVKHLRVGDVESLTIPIPPLEEQNEIVRRVEALFQTADALEVRCLKAKAHVDKLTQSILAKAFRGEIVPQDPNDEPASVLLERIRHDRNGIPGKKVRQRQRIGRI